MLRIAPRARDRKQDRGVFSEISNMDLQLWAVKHTMRKSTQVSRAKQVSNFLICGANNVVERYGKIVTILHRADITGHGHPSPFCQNGWDFRALVGQLSKGGPCRIFILFPQCYTSLSSPHIKKLETYFVLLYFWTFTQCAKT